MTDKIRPPWTPQQVSALNKFQRHGGMHPFTCPQPEGPVGLTLHPASPRLLATPDGWACSIPGCDYRQDWAHAFMADPEAWPKPPFGERHGPTPQEVHDLAAALRERRPTSSDTTDNSLRDQFIAAIRSETHSGKGPFAEVPRIADAVLAVRDRELERMKILVAASESPGHAVRMAAQYADRAIENGERADRLAGVLGEMLAAFVHKIDGYRIPRRSAEADVVTLGKWRSILAENLDRQASTRPTPCPACSRADQAGLSAGELHAECKEQTRAATRTG